MSPGRPLTCAALFALAFLPGISRLAAQEIPHIEPPREHPEYERDQELLKAPQLPKDPGVIHLPHEDALGFIRNLNAKKPPQTLRWEKTADASGRPYAMDGSTKVDLDAVKLSLNRGRIVMNEGAPPRSREWRELNAAYSDQIITHEPESANRDPEAIHGAIALGNRPLDPTRVKVFNALPHETELQKYFQEQNRMGIGGTLEYWKDLHEDIHANSRAMLPHSATKAAVLKELRSGSSDVLILYAHFDGEHLYMPGAQGGTISIDELAKIDRTKDPSVRERVVVLVACKTGARTPEDPRSLTSVLLEKGIARTVLATDRPYDSREIPALLHRLASGVPLRKAVALDPQNAGQPAAGNPAQSPGFLQQYVELEAPAPRFAPGATSPCPATERKGA